MRRIQAWPSRARLLKLAATGLSNRAPRALSSGWCRRVPPAAFDCLWINEEHLSRNHDTRSELCLSPIVLAAAVAANTRTIRMDTILGYWPGTPITLDRVEHRVAPEPLQRPHPPV